MKRETQNEEVSLVHAGNLEFPICCYCYFIPDAPECLFHDGSSDADSHAVIVYFVLTKIHNKNQRQVCLVNSI